MTIGDANNKGSSTLVRLSQLRASCNIEKKKHYNAADRKNLCHWWLGIPVVVITVALGTAFFATLSNEFPDVLKWAGGVAGFLSAVLAGIQTKLNLPRAIEGHRAVAGRFLAIAQRSSNIIAYRSDGLMPEVELKKHLEELTTVYEEVVKDASVLPTSTKDFRKAQQGIADGEETYTDKELNKEGD